MNRRKFIRNSVLTAFSISGLTRLVPRAEGVGSADVELVAEWAEKTMVDGVRVPVWRFRDLGGNAPGPGALESGLVMTEGERLNMTLYNDIDRPIKFVIPGHEEETPVVSPGSSRSFPVQAPTAGSYFFCDGLNGELSRAMGLAGPLIVMPNDGSDTLYPGGEAFDRQYTLFLNEVDSRLNQAVSAGVFFDMDDFEPNYFFVNGLSYPDTAHNDETLLSMRRGENVAIRFISAGLITNPMHFHGYHVRVATRDRVVERAVIDKDTVLIRGGECVDVMLPCTQAGIFPLHTHYIPGVTANGVYVNPYGGALIIMSAA